MARGLEWRDGVTEPRQIEPGRTLMVTTRTFRRTFFLTPSSTVNDVMQYVIGYACRKHGVGLVSAVVLSNHMHLLVNDHLGNAPEFVQTVNSLVARALNAKRGEHGGMFARDNVDLKLVCGRAEAITAIAYIGANPVAAACVEHGRDWPGLRSQPRQLARTDMEVSRPTFFMAHKDLGYRGRLRQAAREGQIGSSIAFATQTREQVGREGAQIRPSGVLGRLRWGRAGVREGAVSGVRGNF